MRGFEGKSAENNMARRDEQLAGFAERNNGMQVYVDDALSNEKLVASLLGQAIPKKIGTDPDEAKKFARHNGYLIPQEVRELGEEYVIAYVLKLASELDKPKYNH